MEFYKTEKPNSFLNRSIITNNTNNTWPSECLPISFVYVNNKYVYSCIIIVVGLVLCVLDECPYTFFLWLPPIHYLTAPSRYGWGMVSCIAHTQWLLCLCSSMNFFHRFGYVMMSQRVRHINDDEAAAEWNHETRKWTMRNFGNFKILGFESNFIY